ncbi:Ubiquitin Thioesterase Zranb1 [Manis pentadactyla]|nr:Ubiquitin Thioesterase Zranb1 [Manis pentadactyla]
MWVKGDLIMEVDMLGKLRLFGLMISAVSGQRKATPAAGFGMMEMGCGASMTAGPVHCSSAAGLDPELDIFSEAPCKQKAETSTVVSWASVGSGLGSSCEVRCLSSRGHSRSTYSTDTNNAGMSQEREEEGPPVAPPPEGLQTGPKALFQGPESEGPAAPSWRLREAEKKNCLASPMTSQVPESHKCVPSFLCPGDLNKIQIQIGKRHRDRSSGNWKPGDPEVHFQTERLQVWLLVPTSPCLPTITLTELFYVDNGLENLKGWSLLVTGQDTDGRSPWQDPAGDPGGGSPPKVLRAFSNCLHSGPNPPGKDVIGVHTVVCFLDRGGHRFLSSLDIPVPRADMAPHSPGDPPQPASCHGDIQETLAKRVKGA